MRFNGSCIWFYSTKTIRVPDTTLYLYLEGNIYKPSSDTLLTSSDNTLAVLQLSPVSYSSSLGGCEATTFFPAEISIIEFILDLRFIIIKHFYLKFYSLPLEKFVIWKKIKCLLKKNIYISNIKTCTFPILLPGNKYMCKYNYKCEPSAD